MSTDRQHVNPDSVLSSPSPVHQRIILRLKDLLDSTSVLWVAWGLYLFLAAAMVFVLSTPVTSDPFCFVQIAKSAARGDGFMEGYLYAYRPPGFPALLGLAIAMGLESERALKLVMVVVMSTTVPLVWLLCRDLFGRTSASVGALLAACFPWFVRLPDLMFSEGLFLPCFVLLFWLLHRALRRPSVKRFALAGVACGLTALVREVVFYLPALLLFAMAVTTPRRSYLKQLRMWIVFTCCQLTVIAPWTVRNYTVFGSVIPISTNPWINLYIGNNRHHDSVESFTWAIPEGLVWNKRPQPNGEDELAATAKSKQAVLEYIRQQPDAFLVRAVRKMWVFVTPSFGLVGQQGSLVVALALLVNLVLYCFFLVGFVVLLVRRVRHLRSDPFLLLAVCYAGYTVLVSGLTYSNSRYRLPLTMVALVLSSGVWGHMIVRERSSKVQPREE